MADAPHDIDLGEIPNLPTLPGLVRILGNPHADGSHEEVRFSCDGRIVLASLYEGMSRAYDVGTGQLLLETSSYQVIDRIQANPRRATWETYRFLFHVVTRGFGLWGGLDPKLTAAGKKLAWELGRPTGLADFDRASGQVRKIEDEWATLSPDGRVWASLDGDAPITFSDAQTGARISTSRRGSTAGDTGARAFSRDARLFAAERTRGVVGVWDVPSGQVSHALKSHTGDVSALAISPDARLLASAGNEGALVLWDLEAGEWISRQMGWQGGVSSLDFLLRSGRLLLAVTDTTTLGLFEVPSLAPATRIARGDDGLGITALGAAPDGVLLAVGRMDDTVHLLDVAALLAAPERIEGDPVAIVTTGPPTGEDDRRAAEAFRSLVQTRLGDRIEACEAALRTLVASLPEAAARVIVWVEPLDVCGTESAAWQAINEMGEELAGGKVTFFDEPVLSWEALQDPRYQSAETPPEETLERLFTRWLARRWQAVAPRQLKGVLAPPDREGNEFDLWRERWSWEE